MVRLIKLEVTNETKENIFYSFEIEKTNIFGKKINESYTGFKSKDVWKLNDRFTDTGRPIFIRFTYLQDAINAELDNQGYSKNNKNEQQ